MTKSLVAIRALTDADVDSAAALHRAAFTGFFLARLGERVLREFYRSTLRVQDCISLVATMNGEIVGVVTGTTVAGGYFRRLLRARFGGYVAAVFLATWYRPWLALAVARRMIGRGATDPLQPQSGLLSSLCVATNARGQGIGADLVLRFEGACRERGQFHCQLTTDAANNEATNRFYRRGQWVLADSYEALGERRMNLYTKYLAPPPETA